ncbi:hypothetical protein ACTOB_003719 [Actinoplanes oblitus]|uniref:Uncharacterized protein n=1 Tax=Actinoplanes oblitus TaxID=3040509 RepID=A0ABY8WRF8_9ACTN|nr:hypothetical protein [Actinoplanes oblitus]WIN00043.1 hypothetical protein ACTOB_003719 [Actinoplanes oblitus]
MPANADGSCTPKNRNTTPNESDPSTDRRVKVVATGGCSTLLVSSLSQALDLVPANLQTELHSGIALAATLGLAYLVLPRKAKITLEWER